MLLSPSLSLVKKERGEKKNKIKSFAKLSGGRRFLYSTDQLIFIQVWLLTRASVQLSWDDFVEKNILCLHCTRCGQLFTSIALSLAATVSMIIHFVWPCFHRQTLARSYFMCFKSSYYNICLSINELAMLSQRLHSHLMGYFYCQCLLQPSPFTWFNLRE